MTPTSLPTRWIIAATGALLQVCLGTVYAWSYFQEPVVRAFRCNQSQAAWAFSLAIAFLGLAAAWGGINLPKFGPSRLAILGGLLYAAGYGVSACAVATHSLALFYAGFGVMGGIGLGLGYVTPVATVVKWFPDRKGLMTGLVVMGFGFGALVMSKLIAPLLMDRFSHQLTPVFGSIGLILLALTVPTGWLLRNPPDQVPAASRPVTHLLTPPALVTLSPAVDSRFWSPQFIGMWLVFFCNITAGIMFISFQSPMLQALWRKHSPALTAAELTAAGATLIACSSVFNGLGRLFWGGLSDRVGRLPAFRLILGTQSLVMISLLWVSHPLWFGVLVCYILLCYGGGFGTMPSYVADVLGPARMPRAYGALLTAWSAAGIIGPQIAAIIKDRFPDRASSCTFLSAALLLAIGFGLCWWQPGRKSAA